MLNLTIIEGTTRPKRQSIHVARLIEKIAKDYDNINTHFVDPADLDLPKDGKDPDLKDPKYSQITKKSDGFFIIVPEYNHSFPGSLKRTLDSELDNYIHKPVALAGVSSGRLGGVRAIESILPVLRELGLVVTFTDILFPRVKDLFDSDGKLLDNKYKKRIKRSLDELVWMANTLKWGRQNLTD